MNTAKLKMNELHIFLFVHLINWEYNLLYSRFKDAYFTSRKKSENII